MSATRRALKARQLYQDALKNFARGFYDLEKLVKTDPVAAVAAFDFVASKVDLLRATKGEDLQAIRDRSPDAVPDVDSLPEGEGN